MKTKLAQMVLGDKRITISPCKFGFQLQLSSKTCGVQDSMLLTREEALKWWADMGELFRELELDHVEHERRWIS